MPSAPKEAEAGATVTQDPPEEAAGGCTEGAGALGGAARLPPCEEGAGVGEGAGVAAGAEPPSSSYPPSSYPPLSPLPLSPLPPSSYWLSS